MGDYQSLFSSIATVVMVAAAIYQSVLMRRQLQMMTPKSKQKQVKTPYWPLIVICVAGIGIAWTPVWFNTTNQNQYQASLLAWGLNPQNQQTGFIRVDSRRFLSQRKGFRLAAACFHYYGIGDAKDSPNISKSALYDIVDQPYLDITIPFNQQFEEERKKGHGSNYALLLVPNGVKMDQFSTIHEAEALGVKMIDTGAGSP